MRKIMVNLTLKSLNISVQKAQQTAKQQDIEVNYRKVGISQNCAVNKRLKAAR